MYFNQFVNLLFCLGFFLVSCTPSVQVQEILEGKKSSESQDPGLNPQSDEMGCKRPYGDESIWNVPIDWSIARIRPNSASMIAAFFKDNHWIGSEASKYTSPIYFATNETPLVTVQLNNGRSYRDAFDDRNIKFGVQGGTVQVPIPVLAQPAPGSDSQLAVINLDSGEEWGIKDCGPQAAFIVITFIIPGSLPWVLQIVVQASASLPVSYDPVRSTVEQLVMR
jgi:hypothetical protein